MKAQWQVETGPMGFIYLALLYNFSGFSLVMPHPFAVVNKISESDFNCWPISVTICVKYLLDISRTWFPGSIEQVNRIIHTNLMFSLLQNCYMTNWRYIEWKVEGNILMGYCLLQPIWRAERVVWPARWSMSVRYLCTALRRSSPHVNIKGPHSRRHHHPNVKRQKHKRLSKTRIPWKELLKWSIMEDAGIQIAVAPIADVPRDNALVNDYADYGIAMRDMDWW